MIGVDGIAYGGDYNPEQWPPDVWEQDVRLMRQAGVNLVSLGIFSWAMLEPRPGQFTFDWLDHVITLLHQGGVRINLATPTAAPPAWLFRADPAARPMTREGHRHGGGTRQAFCPNSPTYAEAAARITRELGQRYGSHPAVALWHVHNEYGGVNMACACDRCAEAFRIWLRHRYGDLAGLNEAWGTTFWGQRYGEWEEIEPPRYVPIPVNPAQELDFLRCANHAHLANYRRERDLLRELSPGVPITTNFMIANCKEMDYWAWAGEVDVVANDHYLQAERPDNHIELAMAADLTRAVAGGKPWLLMEHSTSAVNWQARNLAKRPGELARNSLGHLARGADGIMFFQWRASRFGGEKFHSAMVPHGGTDTRIWREVVELGADLGALAGLRGSTVEAEIALIWDWESWWAMELPWHPSTDLDYRERVETYYTALWNAHQTVDFARPEGELGRYRMVVVPSLYLTTPAAAKNLTDYVRGGGTVVVSYFSGIVDETDAVHPGGYPGALRELLGCTVEEFLPLRSGQRVSVEQVTGGSALAEPIGDGLTVTGGPTMVGDVWAEDVRASTAVVTHRYVDGPAAGGPAVLRNTLGAGTAWYVSTRLDLAGVSEILTVAMRGTGGGARGRALPDGVPAGMPDGVSGGVPAGVEAVVRRGGDGPDHLVVINHTDQPARLPAPGQDLIVGERAGARLAGGELDLPAGAVAVLRLPLSSGNRPTVRAAGNPVRTGTAPAQGSSR
ncbi:MAG: beta-galactosidase [Micromonosporaceae bacterium]|nr:beta-galactosidase [Micromonosporaceae bacterium]